MRPSKILVGILFAAVGVLDPSRGYAETVEIAPSHEAKIILAGLSFFRGLPSDESGNLHILVLGSCPVADALGDLDGKSINGLALRFDRRARRPSDPDLRKALEARRYAAAYDCDRGDDAKAFVDLALEKRVILIAPNSRAVENGALLATEVSQGRPGLVLNMSTVRTVGANFDARLAGVARFIP